MKRILIAFLLFAVASVAACFLFRPHQIAATISPNEALSYDHVTRNYRLVIPHTLSKPAPVVFAYHGMGDSTESMANYSRLDRLASRYGFILVYPAVANSSWAMSDITPGSFDENPDIRFFDQLLVHLSDRYEIDRSRIYAVGISNGASFVQVLAIARSNDLAAIVAHSGPKPRGLGVSENPRPIMLIVGDEDLVSSAIESDADQYRAEGHAVRFVVVPGLGHEWSAQHNIEMWEFLSQFSSGHKP